MLEKIKNINIKKICEIFILLQPIIDMITSVLVRNVSNVLTLGIFIRSIFLILSIGYSLLVANRKDIKKLIIYYAIVLLYSAVFIISMYLKNGTAMIFTQIKGIIKCFYMPLILVSLITIFKNKKINISNDILIATLLIYCLIIAISKICGIAYPSYNIGLNEGTMGLFYAANEIGIILGILASSLFFNVFNKKINGKKKLYAYIFTIAMYIFSILEMGTKVPILSFTIIMFAVTAICIIKIFKDDRKLYIKKLGGIISIAIFIVIIVPYTSVGKNIEKNYGINFFKISEVTNILKKAEKNSNNEISNKEKEKVKNENKAKQEIIFSNKEEATTVIISGRNVFLKNNLEEYLNSTLVEKIIGIGYLNYRAVENDLSNNSEANIIKQKNIEENSEKESIDEQSIEKTNNEIHKEEIPNELVLSERKTVEIDYYDIFFMHGIAGAIIFFIPILVLAYKIIKLTIKNIKAAIIDVDIINMYAIILLALCVAMTAGHTLVAPAVSIYIVFEIIELYLTLSEINKKNTDVKEVTNK